MSIVGFVQLQETTINSIKQAILKSLDLINFSFAKETKSVAIKPNMAYYWDYSTGQTTDPKFVGALIDVIREEVSSNVRISIVESDASAMKCKYAFPLLGYKQLAEQYKVDLVNLTEDKSENVQITVNGHDFDLPVPRTIQEADLRINIPKIKYIDAIRVSSGMKNIFGCNPIPEKYKFHPLLNETIVALNKIMKFDLHILDGIILLGTFPRRLNLVMASTDPVAFDAATYKISGENPRKSKCITLAKKEGLGDIQYLSRGIDPAVFEKNFPKKKFSDKFVAGVYALAVEIGIFRKG